MKVLAVGVTAAEAHSQHEQGIGCNWGPLHPRLTSVFMALMALIGDPHTAVRNTTHEIPAFHSMTEMRKGANRH